MSIKVYPTHEIVVSENGMTFYRWINPIFNDRVPEGGIEVELSICDDSETVKKKVEEAIDAS